MSKKATKKGADVKPFTAVQQVPQKSGCAVPKSEPLPDMAGQVMQALPEWGSPRVKLAKELDALVRREAYEEDDVDSMERRLYNMKAQLATTKAEIKLVRYQLSVS